MTNSCSEVTTVCAYALIEHSFKYVGDILKYIKGAVLFYWSNVKNIDIFHYPIKTNLHVIIDNINSLNI